MGETRIDRIKMLLTLNKLSKSPKSIPINLLEKVKGTPLAQQQELDIFEFIRTIAVTRIVFPEAFVRLSAGRQNISQEAQTMCFSLELILFFMAKNYLLKVIQLRMKILSY